MHNVLYAQDLNGHYGLGSHAKPLCTHEFSCEPKVHSAACNVQPWLQCHFIATMSRFNHVQAAWQTCSVRFLDCARGWKPNDLHHAVYNLLPPVAVRQQLICCRLAEQYLVQELVTRLHSALASISPPQSLHNPPSPQAQSAETLPAPLRVWSSHLESLQRRAALPATCSAAVTEFSSRPESVQQSQDDVMVGEGHVIEGEAVAQAAAALPRVLQRAECDSSVTGVCFLLRLDFPVAALLSACIALQWRPVRCIVRMKGLARLRVAAGADNWSLTAADKALITFPRLHMLQGQRGNYCSWHTGCLWHMPGGLAMSHGRPLWPRQLSRRTCRCVIHS